MKILVTGSNGHLGEALVRTLRETGHEVVGLDLAASAFTDHPGSITDRAHVRGGMRGVAAVLHTATRHKPHVATHSRQDFVETNISGTLNLLEEAAAAGGRAFVFTSTTSTFGGRPFFFTRAARWSVTKFISSASNVPIIEPGTRPVFIENSGSMPRCTFGSAR